MNIREFHKFNRLARRGLVDPLMCHHCETEYVIRATFEGEPLLQCFGCPSTVTPGLSAYERVVMINKEFFDA